jgi:hypothetical protein
MQWLHRMLLIIAYVYALLIPAWIGWISNNSWSLNTKKVVIVAMVMISFLLTLVAILRPAANLATEMIGGIVWIFYLLIVIVAAIYYWPR